LETRASHTASARDHVTVELVQDSDGLLTLRQEWNDLVEGMRLPSPFQSWEWNWAWWRHYGEEKKLQILVFRLDTQVIGIAQLCSRRDAGLISITPLGWEDYDRREGLTEIWGFVFPEANRELLWRELAEWLQASKWHVALLPHGSADRLPTWLARRTVKREMSQLFFRPLPHSWTEFISRLNKSMRDNVKYYPRLLVREGHDVRFRIASSPDEVAKAVDRMIELHRLRAATGPGQRHHDYFSLEATREFIKDVSVLLAKRAAFKVGELEVDGELVAAQAWMETDSTMFMQYSGFKADWARYSVGMICTLEALKDASARGLKRVEFLRGPAQFKDRWDVEMRAEGHSLVARRPLLMRGVLSFPPSWRRNLRDAIKRGEVA
jgi:CelD/BcsL family acetyltransferase involved in cellulose biosynthesis